MPNDSKLSWNILSAPQEPLGSLAAVHSSCVNCLPATSPATRDHRQPRSQGHWQVGPESELSLLPQHGSPGQPGEQGQGCVAKRSQAPAPLFLPADGMGPASGLKGT